MSIRKESVRVYISVARPQSDKARVQRLAGELADRLRALDNVEVVEFQALDGVGTQEGARTSAAGKMIVQLSKAEAVQNLVDELSLWLASDRSRSMQLEVGNHYLEISGMSGAEQNELLEWFRNQAAFQSLKGFS